MVTVKVYVEGGGDTDSLRSKCREGFRGFLEKAGFEGRMPRIVACGGRISAYEHFKTACEAEQPALLLVDSEEIVTIASPWMHLKQRKGDEFVKPANATDDHCHLMVVCMESWFLADKEKLTAFFNPDFSAKALPQNQNIESISKKDVFDGLKKATAHCKTKKPYDKGDHSFDILAIISPEKVANASPWAKRFLEKLNEILNP